MRTRRFPFLPLVIFLTAAAPLAQRIETIVDDPPHAYEAIAWGPGNVIRTPDFIRGFLLQLSLEDGSLDTLASGLSTPLGAAFDPAGNFYYSDSDRSRVLRITPQGTDTIQHPDFRTPTNYAVDTASGLVYLTDYFGDRVHVYDPATDSSRVLVSGQGLDGPDGIILDHDGNLLVANFQHNRIYRVTPAGAISRFAVIEQSPDTGYLTRYKDGYLVAGYGSNRIFFVDRAGNESIWAPVEATYFRPNGLALSPTGDSLLVTEGDGSVRGRIRLITGLNTSTTARRAPAPPLSHFSLFPNPTPDDLHLSLTTERPAHCRIAVYDLRGQLITRLPEQQLARGAHELTLSLPDSLSSGHYICRIRFADGAETARWFSR